MQYPEQDHAQVLVVDDDEPIRETVRGILEDVGYAVIEAGDGLEALERMRADGAPRVVLLDLRMPRMDGGGVLRAVAADAALASHHAIVLMTANLPSVSPDVDQLLERLQVPVVTKPFDLDVLLDAVALAEQRLSRW